MFDIINLPTRYLMGRQGAYTRSLRLLNRKREAGVGHDGYQTVMVCIAVMTLLLKVIEFILNQIKK